MKKIKCKVKQEGIPKGSNTNFIVKETNPYFNWYKNNPYFKCKEID